MKNLSISFEIDLRAERKAHQYYYKAILQMNAKRTNGKKEVISEQLKVLETFNCTSVRFIQHYYTLRIIEDLHKIDYPSAKKTAIKALQILEGKKGVYRSHLQLFTRIQAIAHTALGEYKQADKLFVAAQEYVPPRSFNKGLLFYYQAINALHGGDYQKAYALYRQHRKTRFNILSEQLVYYICLYVLLEKGRKIRYR